MEKSQPKPLVLSYLNDLAEKWKSEKIGPFRVSITPLAGKEVHGTLAAIANDGIAVSVRDVKDLILFPLSGIASIRVSDPADS